MDEFLTNKELFSLIEVIIDERAFSKMELLALTDNTEHRKALSNEFFRLLTKACFGKEVFYYSCF